MNIVTDKETSSFEDTGISNNVKAEEKRLFNEIKQIVHTHVTKGGHDYVPEAMEYRASSVGTCSRKILLEKDLLTYFDEDDLQLLPMWYRQGLEEDGEVPIEFGAHISGQIVHEVIQDALADRILSMEVEISKRIGNAVLKGHYDLLMEYDTGEQVVIDIKSTKSPRQYLPSDKHLRQLMAYQWMLGGIDGALLYVNRNTFQMSYVSQVFDPDEFSKIAIKLSQLAKFEKDQILPPPIPEFDYECSNMSFQCPFYQYCFPGGKKPEIEDTNT